MAEGRKNGPSEPFIEDAHRFPEDKVQSPHQLGGPGKALGVRSPQLHHQKLALIGRDSKHVLQDLLAVLALILDVVDGKQGLNAGVPVVICKEQH